MQTRQAYQKAHDFVQKGHRGRDDHCSSDTAFFINVRATSEQPHQAVHTKLEEVRFPEALRRIYAVIGAPTSEYKFGDWILMSLDEVIKRQRPHAVDFALAYHGMGYIVVCSYNPITQKIHYRYDGGCNGHERAEMARLANIPPDPKTGHAPTHWIDHVDESASSWV